MTYVILVILIVSSGIFSGLTIGMFSLSVTGLERKIRLGDRRAEKVLEIRKNGNFLLCTLLLGNVAVNSGISIIMSEIASGLVAGLVSTAIIFVFGEVLPQAVFARFALRVGYSTAWLVKIFMFFMWPLAKPLALLLDLTLGKEFPELYNKQELVELINDHEQESIDADERRILIGAMHFSEKSARDVMTPISVTFFLEDDTALSYETIDRIRDQKFSRIPVVSATNRDNVIGILYAKDLIGYKVGDETVGCLPLQKNLECNEETKLDHILNLLIKTKQHMITVHNEWGTFLGVVTLEDIVEQVLATEIMDESDDVIDMQTIATVTHAANSAVIE